MKYVLVTGCSGFIGFHFSRKLLKKNKSYYVVGIDNYNNNYDIKYKVERTKILRKFGNFKFIKLNIININENKILKNFSFDTIFNFAAQPGVNYSLKNERPYIENNIIALSELTKFGINSNVNNFFYCSSSSVYGNQKSKVKENNPINSPESFYSLSKIFNDYYFSYKSKLYPNIKFVGLRFFTVYGPYGRPDMSIYNFISSILNNKKIILFNKGKNYRDFTYIDDVINNVYSLYKKIKNQKKNYSVYNLGNGNSISTIEIIRILEKLTKIKAYYKLSEKIIGDVPYTKSNNSKLKKIIKKIHKTDIYVGLKKTLNSLN